MGISSLPVDVYNYSTKEDFLNFTGESRKPLLIRGLDIGPCKTKWSVEFLRESIKNTPIIVHVSPTHQMNFLKKNFAYMKMPFDEFLLRASGEAKGTLKPLLCENEVLYYRSVSFDRRGRECSDLHKLFPSISDDFFIPDVFNPEDFFSSVFRISAPKMQVWTHYDIMDNILVQVIGSKRVVLYSPDDAEYMYLDGDKSEVLDIDDPDIKKYPLFLNALRYECILEPGEAVFIPSLWFHNIMNENFSISINIFWKNLPHDLYDKRDVYGNKDLLPASKAFTHLKKVEEALKSLPDEYRKFYLQRCIADLNKIINHININKKFSSSSEEIPSTSGSLKVSLDSIASGGDPDIGSTNTTREDSENC